MRHLLAGKYAPSEMVLLLLTVGLLVSHRWDSLRTRRQARKDRRAWIRQVRQAELRRMVMRTYVVRNPTDQS